MLQPHHAAAAEVDHNDELFKRIYIGRRFRDDIERLEKLLETTKVSA